MLLTAEQIAERDEIITQLHDAGSSVSEIARAFKMSRQGVINIVRGYHQVSNARQLDKLAAFERLDGYTIDLSLGPGKLALRFGVGVNWMTEWLATRHPDYTPPVSRRGHRSVGGVELAKSALRQAEIELTALQRRIAHLKAVIDSDGAISLKAPASASR